MQREDAESIAIQALVHIGQEPELLNRFMALTGIESQDIRQAAREPGFLAGVIDFVLAHEPTLDGFCARSGIEPADVASALPVLSNAGVPHDQAD